MNLKKFINISWYIKQKPYAVHTAYDVFYLEICRELFSIIKTVNKEYEDDEDVINLDENDWREMAYGVTAYFEDQVNEIGFWKSLTELHKKQFGKRLPFFDAEDLETQEEEWEDILPADIHYLAYILYVNLLTDEESKTVVFFNMPFFSTLAEKIFNYLVEIKEVFTTSFYENYLVPEEDYINFKNQLDWFTVYGYLTRLESALTMKAHLHNLKERKTEDSLIMPLMYAERDRMLFEIPSSFTAFFPADILAGAMRCSDKKKAEIINLKWRPRGIFHVQRETNIHYRFLHTSTGEEFDVLKSSFVPLLDISKEEYWICTIAGWGGEYYISGMCLPSPYRGEEIYTYNLEMQHNFQKHFPEYRKQIEKTALNYRNAAADFFGSDLIVFDTGNQLQKKMNEFTQWYFDTITDKTKLVENTKPLLFTLPANLLAARGIALFIPPADGLQFIIKHRQLLHTLQTTEADEVDFYQINELLNMLSDSSIGAEYWNHLKKNFPLPNLSLFVKCSLDTDEDLEALLRIYLPLDFSPLKLPRFNTVNSDKISSQTVRDIFSKTDD